MADKTIQKRIAAAREDRSRHQPWIDETLRLGMPTYRRVAGTTTSEGRADEQDDLFDTTLQTTIEDFASDMISTFTPRHDRWVLFEPSEALSEGEVREIGPQLQQIGTQIFAEIERSNYWEAAQECFAFWAVSAMAVAVSDMGPLNPLHFQPIEIPRKRKRDQWSGQDLSGSDTPAHPGFGPAEWPCAQAPAPTLNRPAGGTGRG